MKYPKTKQEWQVAVDAAEGALAVDSARIYGLITTNIQVDTERCQMILDEAAGQGIYPAKDAIDRFVRECCDAI